MSAVVCRCILVLVYWYQVTAGVYYHAWIDLKSTIRIMAVATVPLTALEPSGVLVFWVRHHDVVAPAWFEFAIGYYVVVTRHQAWARDVTLLSEARASRPRGYFLPVRCWEEIDETPFFLNRFVSHYCHSPGPMLVAPLRLAQAVDSLDY